MSLGFMASVKTVGVVARHEGAWELIVLVLSSRADHVFRSFLFRSSVPLDYLSLEDEFR